MGVGAASISNLVVGAVCPGKPTISTIAGPARADGFLILKIFLHKLLFLLSCLSPSLLYDLTYLHST